MIEKRKRRLQRRISRAMFALAVCLHCAPLFAADPNLENYRDLKPIASFGSISVSVYNADSSAPESEAAFSSEELTQYLQLQATSYFPDVPYIRADASGGPDPKDNGSVGYLLCRVWLDSSNTPAVFQVRCQISTSTHVGIIHDVSFGYGPKEKAPAIIREQIDQILRGIAAMFARVRSEM